MYRDIGTVILAISLIGCGNAEPETQSSHIEPSLLLSEETPLGTLPASSDRPTIAHVRIVDLDQDGQQDVLICDVLRQQVSWIRQSPSGVFAEQAILSNVQGAVHVEAVDVDDDGDLDVVIAAMGVILPSDAHLGQVIILENDGQQQFVTHLIADGIQRVTDVQVGDLDGDGDADLAVAQFGYTQGEVQWFQNEGDWNFTPHQLLDLSGAIHAPIIDIDNDGDLDILALLSQEWETVYAFINDSKGAFTQHILHDVTDADFSSSGISVADLDGDGDEDVIWTNGDAFVAVDYRPLPTHGLQWLENRGDLNFVYHRIGQMDGAYGPTTADMDGDGDLDIVTVAEFAFWDEPNTPSVMWWEQGVGGSFTPHVLATTPTHLVTCDVGDLDGNGFPDIVAGGMALYPPFDNITRVTSWFNRGATKSNTKYEKAFPRQVKVALAEIPHANSGIRGMILHANGLDARAEYMQAMLDEPNNPKWSYYLGMLDVLVGDSASALKHFEHAEKLDDSYAPLKTRLGELYVGIGNIELAIEKLKQASTAHATVELAQIAASNNDWQEVIRILQGETIPAAVALTLEANAKLHNEIPKLFKAIDMGYQMNDPWLLEVEEKCVLAPYLVTLAQTDLIAGRIGEAETLLRRAISIDPTDKDARLALAGILLKPNRVNDALLLEAIKHLEAGLQAEPEYVMTRAKYGWALFLAKNYDQARQVWVSVLVDEPDHAPVLSNLAQLEMNQQHYAQAYGYYSRAFTVPADSPFSLPNDPRLRSSALVKFALAAKQLQKPDEALQALQSAAVLVPNDFSIQFELGNLLVGEKRYTEALPYLESAHAAQSDNARILAALGYTWFKLGKAETAVRFLEQSVTIAPTFAIGWFHLGNAQLVVGDNSKAIESLKIAVQLQPNFTAAKEALRRAEGR